MKLVKSSDIAYKETLDAWQPFYKEKLSKVDAIEIQDNLNNLYNLLSGWNSESSKKNVCGKI